MEAEKLYCGQCGQRLATDSPITAYNEYDGKPIFGLTSKFCANRRCHKSPQFNKNWRYDDYGW